MRAWVVWGLLVACGEAGRSGEDDVVGIPSLDCAPDDEAVGPTATEVCNGIDDDCDGRVDWAPRDRPFPGAEEVYADADGDGFGLATNEVRWACGPVEGFSSSDRDCDDADPEKGEWVLIFPDMDGDGYGSASARAQKACLDEVPEGWLTNQEDCADRDASVNPGAVEVCDGIDNDCNRWKDLDDPNLAEGEAVWGYRDLDKDGFGTVSAGQWCLVDLPSTVALAPGDCDDGDPAVHPAAQEICDEVDNDCDGALDALDPDAPGAIYTLYRDFEGDGYGDDAQALQTCFASLAGYASLGGDCDDRSSAIHPGAVEACDNQDNDCDNLIDDADPDVDAAPIYEDMDRDGAGGALAGHRCLLPAGKVRAGGDCDDQDARRRPGNVDRSCDGVDVSCDGEIHVPSDVSTIAQAVPRTTPSGLICVEPGVYATLTVELDGRSVMGMGEHGAVVLRPASVGATVLRAGSASATSEVRNLTFDFVDVPATAVHAKHQAVLSNLTVLGPSSVSTQVPGPLFELGYSVGGGTYARAWTVRMEDVAVNGSSCSNPGGVCNGVVLKGAATTLLVDRLTIDGVHVSNPSCHRPFLDVGVTTFTATDLWVRSSSVSCTGSPAAGRDAALLFVSGTNVVIDGLKILDVSVSVSGDDMQGAVVSLRASGSQAAKVERVEARGVTIDVTGDAIRGALLDLGQRGSVRNALVAGVHLQANVDSLAGGLFFAEHTLAADFITVAGVSVEQTARSVGVTPVATGLVAQQSSTSPWSTGLEASHLVLADVEEADSGRGVSLLGATHTLDLAYVDRWSCSEPLVVGVVAPLDLNVRMEVDPVFLDWDPAFPSGPSDLRLAASSPLKNAGDPALPDPDGSPPEFGAYGGLRGDL